MGNNPTESELAGIIGKKPHWMIRWGITILFAFVITVALIWRLRFSG